MPSDKEYLYYLLEKNSPLEKVTYKKNDVGGIYFAPSSK